MHARLVVSSETSSGILARIVGALRKIGLDVDNQEFIENGDSRDISFDLFATKPELIKARSILMGLAGVTGVKAYAIKSKSDSSKSNDSQDAHSLATRLNNAYPNIAEIVHEEMAKMEHASIADTMFSVGAEVAVLRKDTLPQSESNDLIDVIEQVIVPNISDIADPEYAREGFETGLKINVSEFTKPRELSNDLNSLGTLGNEAIKCDFLRGYIQTALTQQQGIDSVSITETRCRNEGHPYCLFEFE